MRSTWCEEEARQAGSNNNTSKHTRVFLPCFVYTSLPLLPVVQANECFSFVVTSLELSRILCCALPDGCWFVSTRVERFFFCFRFWFVVFVAGRLREDERPNEAVRSPATEKRQIPGGRQRLLLMLKARNSSAAFEQLSRVIGKTCRCM